MATTDDPAELARAQLHRDQAARRAAHERARLVGLAGSRTARAALADRWAAVSRDPRHPEQYPAPRPVATPTGHPATYPASY